MRLLLVDLVFLSDAYMCTYVCSFTKHFCVVKLRRFLTAGVAVVNTASFSVSLLLNCIYVNLHLLLNQVTCHAVAISAAQ